MAANTSSSVRSCSAMCPTCADHQARRAYSAISLTVDLLMFSAAATCRVLRPESANS